MIFVLFQVKAVTVQLDDLVSRIKLEQKSYSKLNEPIAISFFSATDDIQQSTMGLNGEFIHYLLLINVLLRMKTVESDKEKLINLLGTTHPDIAMTYENIGIVYEEHKFIYFNKKKEKHKRLV